MAEKNGFVKGEPDIKMGQRIHLSAYVNGYSWNTEGKRDDPIVSLFVPDGHRGFHGQPGTTLWVTRDEYERLLAEEPEDE